MTNVSNTNMLLRVLNSARVTTLCKHSTKVLKNKKKATMYLEKMLFSDLCPAVVPSLPAHFLGKNKLVSLKNHKIAKTALAPKS